MIGIMSYSDDVLVVQRRAVAVVKNEVGKTGETRDFMGVPPKLLLWEEWSGTCRSQSHFAQYCFSNSPLGHVGPLDSWLA